MEISPVATIFLAWLSLFSPGILSSDIELGEIFETESDFTMVQQPAVFVLTKKIFKHGTVTGFKGMFSNSSMMRFQIWRPLLNNEYLLVGQKEFTPTHAPSLFEIPLTPSEFISVEDGDLLGFAKLSSENLVVTQFDGSLSMGVIYSPLIKVDALKVKDVMTLDPTPLPLKFSVMAIYKEGIPDSSKKEDSAGSTLAPKQITKLTIPPRPPDEGSKVYLGASISPRDSVLDQMAHATFLLPVGMLPGGRLVKFYAFFKRKEAVLLQVWREVSSGVEFKLIGQVRYTPTTIGPVEIILDEKDYIPTLLGDCLGFTQLESTSSIGYNFNANMDNSLRPIVASQESALSPGQVMSFTALGVPYDFAMGAMVDTAPGPISSVPVTPHSYDGQLIIPTEPGELVLSQSLVSNLGSINIGASRTYLMESLQFPEHAFITAFSAYFVNDGLVQFQIWRRVSWREELFELVGKKDYLVTSAPGLRTIRLEDSVRIPVREGDFIGFVNPGSLGVIGYVFDSQVSDLALYTSVANVNISPGEKVAFDVLAFPYKFSVAVNYIRREADDDEDGTFGINRFDDVTAQQTPSPEPVPAGIQLENGEQFISQAMEPTLSAISRKAAQTYIVATLQVPEEGRITSFSAYIVNPGLLQFQIWRQISVTSFALVGTQNITVTSGPRFLNVRLTNQIKVEEGDMLGYVNANDKGIIGYKFEESTTGNPVYICPALLNLSPNHQEAFDLIRLPYKFSLAATYRPVLKARATSGVVGLPEPEAEPEGLNPSDLAELPGYEPPSAVEPSSDSEPPSDLETSTSGSETSASTDTPFGFLSTPSGKNNENGLNPSGENADAKDKNSLLPKRNLGFSEQENIQAALRPLSSVYLTLILLLWLIVLTLILIGCFVFRLYKKKKTRPFNYYSYRSSSVPSLAGSQDLNKRDSIARFYNSTGLLGGPGFPDNRYDTSSRAESFIDSDDRTYL